MYDPGTEYFLFESDDVDHIKGSGGAAITDAAIVHQWQNGGTSPGKFVQSGSVALPTWYASGPIGKPRLRFGGSHAMILDNLAGLTSLDGLTLFVVAAVDNPAVVQAMLSLWTAASGGRNRALIHIESGNVRMHVRQNDGEVGVPRADGPVNAGQPFIAMVSCDYADGDVHFWRDGVVYATDKFATPGKSPATAPESLGIGGQRVTTLFDQRMTGDFYAFGGVLAPRSPDAAVPLLHYLRTKWGVG